METNQNESDVAEAGLTTERAKERAEEDAKYVPVIVKRTDEARRHPDDTLEQAVQEGGEQLRRRAGSLFVSSVTAGLILGFTAMPVGVLATFTAGFHSELLTRLSTALVYPLGFVICVLSGAQLFTEHTATSVYPVLDRKAAWPALLRLWAIVIAGNLLGAAAIATLLKAVDPVIGAAEGYAMVGRHLVAFPPHVVLLSAVLAGWLMAQGAWLVVGTSSTTSQMLSIYLVTFVIGIGGLHHSIAGAVEMFSAMFVSDEFTLGAAARFIGLALTGNLIGGSIFVAVLNYAHIRRTQTIEHSGESSKTA